jgi:hypothetical protein
MEPPLLGGEVLGWRYSRQIATDPHGGSRVKIKRDPESLRQVRKAFEQSPGWFPKYQLDKLTDEELADAADHFLATFVQWAPRLREAVKPMAATVARLGERLRDFDRAFDSAMKSKA